MDGTDGRGWEKPWKQNDPRSKRGLAEIVKDERAIQRRMQHALKRGIVVRRPASGWAAIDTATMRGLA
jgi:hypothetical protein